VLRYILISIVRGFLTLIGVSVITFALARISGNPLDVLLPDTATAADRAMVAQLWGLDKPLVEQYLIFDANALRGDFGTSFKWSGQAAMGLVLQRLPETLKIIAVSVAFALLVAVPLGVLSSTNRGSFIDRLAIAVAVLGTSLPPFWLAIVMVWVFSVLLGWLPTSGVGGLDHLIMPGLVLGLLPLAALTRLIRSAMLDVLDSEYIKLARLKGLPEWKIVWKHALKNAAIPPITYFGSIIVTLLTVAVIVESIFAWPGVGQLALDAMLARDYPVVLAVTLFISFLFVVMNLLVDVTYAWVDPRVRLGRA
jgi:peptide/nickel transport system permease protein